VKWGCGRAKLISTLLLAMQIQPRNADLLFIQIVKKKEDICDLKKQVKKEKQLGLEDRVCPIWLVKRMGVGVTVER